MVELRWFEAPLGFDRFDPVQASVGNSYPATTNISTCPPHMTSYSNSILDDKPTKAKMKISETDN